ncbi:MAG: 50S ribosomal protein L29 [Janthinobacterium lividum]
MELSKIHELTDAELKTKEAEAGEQLFRVRFQKSLGNTEGIKNLRVIKKDVARFKTIARQRELARVASPTKIGKAEKA